MHELNTWFAERATAYASGPGDQDCLLYSYDISKNFAFVGGSDDSEIMGSILAPSYDGKYLLAREDNAYNNVPPNLSVVEYPNAGYRGWFEYWDPESGDMVSAVWCRLAGGYKEWVGLPQGWPDDLRAWSVLWHAHPGCVAVIRVSDSIERMDQAFFKRVGMPEKPTWPAIEKED